MASTKLLEEFRQALEDAFSIDDLRRLVASIGFEWEEIPGHATTLPVAILGLVFYAQRQRRLYSLAAAAVRANPANEQLSNFWDRWLDELLSERPALPVVGGGKEGAGSMSEDDSQRLLKAIDELLIQVQGSAQLGVPGLQNSMKKLESMVREMQEDVAQLNRNYYDNESKIRNMWFVMLGIGTVTIVILVGLMLLVFG